jgi:tungstate transport system substrate-binding protein
MAKRGDADVLFVHDRAAEEKYVAEGHAPRRYPVMYNDFVLVGPKSDPAGVKGNDIVEALKKISAGNAPFVSRGDKSGTDAAEKRFWTQSPPLHAALQLAGSVPRGLDQQACCSALHGGIRAARWKTKFDGHLR